MTSTIKADVIEAATGTNTALSLKGKGSGVVTIGDGNLQFPDVDGTNGHFIKTNGSGVLSFAEAGGGGLQSVQVFTASGTWTKPAGITKVIVYVQGAGGGGGAAAALNDLGGGGYAGSRGEKFIDVSAISSETVTIGAGGAGGVAGANNGTVGGTSSFGAHVSAPGGPGGYYSTNSTVNQPASSVATGGDVNVSGAPGDQHKATHDDGTRRGGWGGSSTYGSGGAGHDGAAANTARLVPSGYGGGGQGGGNGSAADEGGAGSGGIIIVEEYA